MKESSGKKEGNQAQAENQTTRLMQLRHEKKKIRKKNAPFRLLLRG